MRVCERLLQEHPARASLMLATPDMLPFIGSNNIFTDSLLGQMFRGLGLGTLGINMFMQAFRLHPLAWLT